MLSYVINVMTPKCHELGKLCSTGRVKNAQFYCLHYEKKKIYIELSFKFNLRYHFIWVKAGGSKCCVFILIVTKNATLHYILLFSKSGTNEMIWAWIWKIIKRPFQWRIITWSWEMTYVLHRIDITISVQFNADNKIEYHLHSYPSHLIVLMRQVKSAKHNTSLILTSKWNKQSTCWISLLNLCAW